MELGEVKAFGSKVESYLASEITHEEVSSTAYHYADKVPEREDQSIPEFWDLVFSAIHLSDEEHWKDGSTRRTLIPLVEKLKLKIREIESECN